VFPVVPSGAAGIFCFIMGEIEKELFEQNFILLPSIGSASM